MTLRRSGFWVRLFVLLACFRSPVPAQEVSSLSGNILDASEAALGQAAVTLTNLESGATRTMAADPAGHYSFAQLPPGTYEVRAEKPGFKATVQRPISLAVNQRAIVTLRLELGEVSEQIVVADNAPMVANTVNQISGLIDGPQIRELPLNGRSYDQLLTLNPGVVNYTSQNVGPRKICFLWMALSLQDLLKSTRLLAEPVVNCWE